VSVALALAQLTRAPKPEPRVQHNDHDHNADRDEQQCRHNQRHESRNALAGVADDAERVAEGKRGAEGEGAQTEQLQRMASGKDHVQSEQAHQASAAERQCGQGQGCPAGERKPAR
jgi:hypothetical protein